MSELCHPQNLEFNAKALTNIAEINITGRFAKQFYNFMKGLPYKDYGETRTKLCEHMGWSYWAYLRRLNGNVFISKSSRDKIEEFFNTKIFE